MPLDLPPDLPMPDGPRPKRGRGRPRGVKNGQGQSQSRRRVPQVPEEKAPVLRGPTMGDAQQLRRLLVQLHKRNTEALALYEPLPLAEEFHRCDLPEILLSGSNRGGKSLAACVEVARAVTNQDPHGKWPKKGIFYLVAYDGKNIAEVFYRKMFRAGAFKIIRDPDSGEWRAVRPKHPYDQAHKDLWKLAPPLIPPRFIKEIAWENKKQGVPILARLNTDWEIHFFSSNAEPPMGTDIDGGLFDEEIRNEKWYGEIAARLADRKGRFFWSCTPQNGTDKHNEFLDKIEDDTERVRCRKFKFLLRDNPHLDDEAKTLLMSKYPEGSWEYETRIEGEPVMHRQRVYPEWDARGIHGIDDFPVPPDWTRYISVDPGRQVCGVVFGAVPPPDQRLIEVRGAKVPVDFDLLIYDELYIRECDAAKFARLLRPKLDGFVTERALIDSHESRKHSATDGENLEYAYSGALKKEGVSFRIGGHGFTWGFDDPKGRIEHVRSYLRIGQGGRPRLRVFRSIRALDKEMERYRYKREPSGRITDEVIKKDDHEVDCLGYLCSFEPTYYKPPTVARKPGAVYRTEMKLRREESARAGNRGGLVTVG